MSEAIRPGLLVLHGNRLELLKEAVLDWLARHPLRPLEEEVFLVQSNGVAEWLKIALARSRGICAATRVELPARFMWRSYRQVLGARQVPMLSPLDKSALTWRLMRQLPALSAEPGFEPLASFLNPAADTGRRLQLAQRLADLYDQYQVYRADWLDAWAAGNDVIRALPGSAELPLPDDQRWQGRLWRAVLAELSEAEQATARPQLHRRFLDTLEFGAAPASPVARRVVLFGMSHVPLQTLEALAALSTRSQVLLAIPNPCRYHWGDIMEGRELLRIERRRHASRQADLAGLSLEELHAHANPLLASWGRQGRDFVRQLDAFDDAMASQARFEIPRIDLFDDDEGDTLLTQVQARIRDLVPLAEHEGTAAALAADDRSIVFHIAHGAQREVEILHDQLLALFAAAANGDRPLAPRDVVVMVPAIDGFAPAIRAVFGQYPPSDRRHIPFDIADLQLRGQHPLIVALEWLLRLPEQRCKLAEIRDLLDVPAIARRFGIAADDLPRLTSWMDGAGVRWGLHAEQRARLGLDACGEQNSWLFGLRRMLLGYASGDAGPFDGIEPFDEVGGLEASSAGALAFVVQALMDWWQTCATDATPAQWAERARALVASVVEPVDESDRLTVAAMDDGLRRWLDDCALGGFEEPVPLAVMREAWLGALDEPGIGKRFIAGGVTFCTLLPMRAVPFEVVCLLGMNDGDYPRSTSRSDFDLMGWPGQRRPGDRSRRDDDRYLMLEALLSARRLLYVSWTGRSARDNSEQPASVLVSQLRDYLGAGWGADVVDARTVEHPLQPFSRRYFEAAASDGQPGERPLFTYAREWRAAHGTDDAVPAEAADVTDAIDSMPASAPAASVALTVASLARFLREPVKTFFRDRLDVHFDEGEVALEEDEAFSIDGLEQYGLLSELMDGAESLADVERRADRIQRSGRLPLGEQGARARSALVDAVTPMLAARAELAAAYPLALPKEALHVEHAGLVLDDWQAGSLTHGGSTEELPVFIDSRVNRMTEGKGQVRMARLVDSYVGMLVDAACEKPRRLVRIGRDAVLTMEPLLAAEAQVRLQALMEAWQAGMSEPLPWACDTAIAWAQDQEADKVIETYEGGYNMTGDLGRDPSLARCYPSFDDLDKDGRFQAWAGTLFKPLVAWVDTHVRVRSIEGQA